MLVMAISGFHLVSRKLSPSANSASQGVIDRLNEVGAEDELRVLRQQLTRLVFRAQPLTQR